MISRREIPRMGGRPYLIRRGWGEQSIQQSKRDRATGAKRVRLHHFIGPDDAGHHNHPFAWSFSIVLSVLWGGSYTEEILHVCDWHKTEPTGSTTYPDFDHCIGGECWIETRRVRLFNWIPNGKYHRIVELHPGLFALGVWTLFVMGPRVSSWGFWDKVRGHIPWRQHSAEQGHPIEEGEA